MAGPDPVERLPLSLPVFQVLLSLCDRPMYGYAILTDIQERTDTTVQLGAGTLYAAIKRMAAAGMLEECEPPEGFTVTDPRRRYYDITAHGRVLAQAEARRLHSLAALASQRHLLEDPVPKPSRG